MSDRGMFRVFIYLARDKGPVIMWKTGHPPTCRVCSHTTKKGESVSVFCFFIKAPKGNIDNVILAG